jgi:hypothetical protein
MTPGPSVLDSQTSVNGTLEDVSSFFRVDSRTVRRWMNGKPEERLGHWKCDRSLVFGEEDVVKWWLTFHRAGVALKPGESEAEARRQWREHMKARAEEAEWRQAVERRIESLADEVLNLSQKAAA